MGTIFLKLTVACRQKKQVEAARFCVMVNVYRFSLTLKMTPLQMAALGKSVL